MIKLELTKLEAQVLQELLDAAVRGQGLRVAESAVVLNKKILEAAKNLET